MPSSHRLPPSRSGLLALRMRALRVRDEIALIRRDRLLRKYNPDQPRVPAGSPEGGQWGSGGADAESAPTGFALPSFASIDFDQAWSRIDEGWNSDGSVFEQTVADNAGNRIRSEYAASRAAGFDERQTVFQPGRPAVSFETTDSLQSIYLGGPDGELAARTVWTPDGPDPMRPSSRLSLRFCPPPGPRSLQAARSFSGGSRRATASTASRPSWASTHGNIVQEIAKSARPNWVSLGA